MNPHFKKAAIIGVGLIGGSFGMALKKRNLAGRVIGIGRSPERLQRAVELDAIDEFTTDLKSGVADAELIYVATPVCMEVDFIEQAAVNAKQGCIITDAGSTKAEICRGADAVTPEGIHFIGAHPMAGSENAGVEAASADLFEKAAYVLTPTENTNLQALEIMANLAKFLGSRVYRIDPETHDRCVAMISHLPHLIAAALVMSAKHQSDTNPEVFDLVAGSFRDMTRVAASPPVLWRDITLTNVDGIKEAVRIFDIMMKNGAEIIESRNAEEIEEWFEIAKRIRDSVYSKQD